MSTNTKSPSTSGKRKRVHSHHGADSSRSHAQATKPKHVQQKTKKPSNAGAAGAEATAPKAQKKRKKQKLTLRERKAKDKHPSSVVPLSQNWKQISKTIKAGDYSKNPRKVTVGSTYSGKDGLERKTLDRSKELAQKYAPAEPTYRLDTPLNDDHSLTKFLAIDCEMVGVGVTGERSILAEVCIVNSYGNVVYHEYVAPTEEVTDYRTHVSGVRARDLKNAKSFQVVQKEVSSIIEGRVLIGHHLMHDLKALMLSHPFHMTRDTAKYRPLQRSKGKPRSLKWLASNILNVKIQTGEHSPDQDARASLFIWRTIRKDWEVRIKHSIAKSKGAGFRRGNNDTDEKD